VQVRDLYAGEHWRVAETLPSLVADANAQLWVCSAGYGLVPDTAMVHPYAATLSPGHADSVPGDRQDAIAWWQSLADWRGPDLRAPRTIERLVRSDPDAVFLLVMSATYLHACNVDIEAAAAAISDRDRFMIVSTGTRPIGRLGHLLLPADARLQAYLGGTRGVLNVRLAGDLLAHGLTNRAAAEKYLTRLLGNQPEIKRYDRKPLTDGEVIDWIRSAVQRRPGAKASPLLTEFRASGLACEQGRFKELHRNFTESQSRAEYQATLEDLA
jgi:hypothetical protein